MLTDESDNLVLFTDVLSSVSAIIDSANEECVYMLGNYNTHPYVRFYYELSNFCTEQDGPVLILIG